MKKYKFLEDAVILGREPQGGTTKNKGFKKGEIISGNYLEPTVSTKIGYYTYHIPMHFLLEVDMFKIEAKAKDNKMLYALVAITLIFLIFKSK